MNVPIDTLNAMISDAETLLNIPKTVHPEDFHLVYENCIMLKERLTAIDLDNAPRGDSELLHFLHSPLNVVLAYTDLMIEQPDPALNLEQHRRVRQINAAAAEIGNFIRANLG